MTPEARVKKRVCIVLKELGAYYATLVQASAPDFLVCWRGKFFGVECKASGDKPTALQEKNMKENLLSSLKLRLLKDFAVLVLVLLVANYLARKRMLKLQEELQLKLKHLFGQTQKK